MTDRFKNIDTNEFNEKIDLGKVLEELQKVRGQINMYKGFLNGFLNGFREAQEGLLNRFKDFLNGGYSIDEEIKILQKEIKEIEKKESKFLLFLELLNFIYDCVQPDGLSKTPGCKSKLDKIKSLIQDDIARTEFKRFIFKDSLPRGEFMFEDLPFKTPDNKIVSIPMRDILREILGHNYQKVDSFLNWLDSKRQEISLKMRESGKLKKELLNNLQVTKY